MRAFCKCHCLPNKTSSLVNKGRDCVTLAGTPLPDGLQKGPELSCETTVLAENEAPPKRRSVEQHDIQERPLAEADGVVPFPLPCFSLQQCGFITWTPVVSVPRQENLLPCYQQQVVSPICATHDAFKLVGSTLDAQALKQRDLIANLDELLTPVELRDIEELLMPEIDGGERILLTCMFVGQCGLISIMT